jgi:glycerate kinase
MKVVIAIDSFKGSLTSVEAGEAIKEGILRTCDAEVIIKPLADGGEGTVDALIEGMNGRAEVIEATGPLEKKVVCKYAILNESKTSVLEMAQASGITLIPKEELNPLKTTTYGLGEMIKDAINKGCRNFIVGIGGSATNDGGVGMLQALGFEFLDKNGEMIGLGGGELAKIQHIGIKSKLKELDDCVFRIACDVTNPLLGEKGSTYIYGPQKGANPEMLEVLEKGMTNFSNVVKKELGKDVDKLPGTGAAGGLGYGFLAFLNAHLESGIEIILKEIKFEQAIRNADYVITGEGKLDLQTAMGKGPIGVARLAKKHGIKVIAFAGTVTEGAIKCNEEGIDAYFSIVNGPISLEDSMKKDVARKNMISTVVQVFNLINISSSTK